VNHDEAKRKKYNLSRKDEVLSGPRASAKEGIGQRGHRPKRASAKEGIGQRGHTSPRDRTAIDERYKFVNYTINCKVTTSFLSKTIVGFFSIVVSQEFYQSIA
jgi:hypothetical protein